MAQVDTSAANSTSEGLMWLRLVQSARDKEEQNLEAYVKNGQLFYRSLRRIEKDEELLVWYGKDLIDLLLLSSSRVPPKSKGEPVKTVKCFSLCLNHDIYCFLLLVFTLISSDAGFTQCTKKYIKLYLLQCSTKVIFLK